MKKILLIILLAAAAIPFQNCSPPPEDEPPIVKDTTKTTVSPINTFKFNGITTYNLKWDSTNMFGSYRPGTDQTTIVVEGYSGTNYGAFNLKFPGNKVATYKLSAGNIVDAIVTTGQGIKEKRYEWAEGTGRDIIVTITKYDPVGGRIKGTFNAMLQESGSLITGNISAGAFEVRRDTDEM
jgi:hypothetical protein